MRSIKRCARSDKMISHACQAITVFPSSFFIVFLFYIHIHSIWQTNKMKKINSQSNFSHIVYNRILFIWFLLICVLYCNWWCYWCYCCFAVVVSASLISFRLILLLVSLSHIIRWNYFQLLCIYFHFVLAACAITQSTCCSGFQNKCMMILIHLLLFVLCKCTFFFFVSIIMNISLIFI